MNARPVYAPGIAVFLWLIVLGGCTGLYGPQTGDFQIRSTARLAVLCWSVAMALKFTRQLQFARLAWTLGCGAYLIHVGMAFQYAHHWSHAEAFAHVEQVGGYGEGVYVSYAFTLLWIADAVWWWCTPTSYQSRSAWIEWSVYGFMFFVIFNATVVFESGFIRWAGVAATVAMLILIWRCSANR